MALATRARRWQYTHDVGKSRMMLVTHARCWQHTWRWQLAHDAGNTHDNGDTRVTAGKYNNIITYSTIKQYLDDT